MSDITLKDLLEAGSHFGHQVRRWNPLMKQYIFGQRDKVHIFDLAKTKAGLDEAEAYVTEVTKNGGVILFVGTKRQAADMVKEAAVASGMPYMTTRWMGGMLTNFAQMQKSIRRYWDLKDKREKGELKKYTKKEQLLFDREIARLEKFFGGVASMDKLPDAMFVVDTHREDVAVREAVRLGIPVVGMVDTNGDPALVKVVIPINDDAVNSIQLVIKVISEAIIKARGKQEKKDDESGKD